MCIRAGTFFLFFRVVVVVDRFVFEQGSFFFVLSVPTYRR